MKPTTLCSGLALAGLLVAPALAQALPPPGAVPPPPPGHAAGPPPPPPPRGPAVILDKGAGGTTHVDVRCTEAEQTRACVEIATQLYDKLNGTVQAK